MKNSNRYFIAFSLLFGVGLAFFLILVAEWVGPHLRLSRRKPIDAFPKMKDVYKPYVSAIEHNLKYGDGLGLFPESPETPPYIQRADRDFQRGTLVSWKITPSDAFELNPQTEEKHYLKSATVEKQFAEIPYPLVTHYTIDSLGRRTDPTQPIERPRQEYWAFFGCSFTFGEAIRDEETLPAQVEQLDSRVHAYNYGSPGSTTTGAWMRMKTVRRADLSESQGRVFYIYADAHLGRLTAPSSYLQWARYWPRYALNDAGDIYYAGTYSHSQRLRTWALYNLSKSFWVNYLGIEFPWWVTNDAWKLFRASVLKMERYAKGVLGAKEFYVVVHPFAYRTVGLILPKLEDDKIHYIDFSQWPTKELTFDQESVPYDGHPTGALNRLLAQSLTKELLPEIKASRSE